MTTRRDFIKTVGLSTAGLALSAHKSVSEPATYEKPNILWILAEDASPHVGCYGEKAIDTPNLDALAGSGVRFENAFVTCPVCSPSRSAFVTGLYQTTLGAHNHRSQRINGKGATTSAYNDSYQLPEAVPLISDLFRNEGYYTCNNAGPTDQRPGKTDYNFVSRSAPYDGEHWQACPQDTPFFAQIQLKGGKYRRGKLETDHFSLPPYYPDDPEMRADWASYLAAWVEADREVGVIMEQLQEAELLDNTIIFFLTDHGISHLRGKQFLYEEGIRVPLIVRFPDGHLSDTVRTDLALQIDLAVTSLALAGIPVPEQLHGRNLFDDNYYVRPFIVSARDRCDETIDIIRCVRTERFKYIRNFISYRPHAQDNQYKDGKQIVKTMRQLHADGRLNDLQDRIFDPTRPNEELYDLDNDPEEVSNLAGHADHQDQLAELRTRLYDWMVETNDLGLIPEPILEDLGRKFGNKYHVMQASANKNLNRRLIDIFEAARRSDTTSLHRSLDSDEPCERYWAASWLGHLQYAESTGTLKKRVVDENSTVRVAAALALCKMGYVDEFLPQLIAAVSDKNLLVGMYAMNAIEQTSILDERLSKVAVTASSSEYEFTRRYGKRLQTRLQQAMN